MLLFFTFLCTLMVQYDLSNFHQMYNIVTLIYLLYSIKISEFIALFNFAFVPCLDGLIVSHFYEATMKVDKSHRFMAFMVCCHIIFLALLTVFELCLSVIHFFILMYCKFTAYEDMMAKNDATTTSLFLPLPLPFSHDLYCYTVPSSFGFCFVSSPNPALFDSLYVSFI